MILQTGSQASTLREGALSNIGQGGLCCTVTSDCDVATGAKVWSLKLGSDDGSYDIGSATVIERRLLGATQTLRIVFDEDQKDLLIKIEKMLEPAPYVTDELDHRNLKPKEDGAPGKVYDLKHYYAVNSDDLFAKCNMFQEVVRNFQQQRLYQTMYRVTLTSGLDHRISVYDPMRGCEREMICFDSNSYLGLHIHPRVIEASKRVLERVGYGTPSAQMLGGTNRYLRELEETLARFHGRDKAIIFPSGYAANHGTITAIVRKDDAVVRDQFSHASIHDACRASGSRYSRVYKHLDMKSLGDTLEKMSADGTCRGKLIVTDGVFSMHGAIAPLPGIVAAAKKHGAKIMLDEAHATGVFGRTGHGLEEHFSLEGSVDILMGTFSKTPGSIGGYVCGDKALIDYLRFYANSGLFTASLPSHLCAGLNEAYRILDEEPEHREHLWENVKNLKPRLRNLGLITSEEESPILTIFVGTSAMLASLSGALFENGIKCGTVDYPAVPRGEAILRLSVNARHTQEDLDRVVDTLGKIAKAHHILGCTREEIVDLGTRLNPNQ